MKKILMTFPMIHYRAVHPLHRYIFAALSLILAMLPMAAEAAAIESSDPEEDKAEIVVAPVIIDGNTLFYVRGVSAFPSEKRAHEIAARIQQLAANPELDPDTLQISERENASVITAGNLDIVFIFDADAGLENLDRKLLAQVYLKRIQEAIREYRQERTLKALITSVVYIAIATASFVIFFWLGHRTLRYLRAKLDRRLRNRLEGLESQSFHIVRAKQIGNVLQGIVNLAWIAAVVLAVLWYLQFALGSLPWTRLAGDRLLTLLVEPLQVMGHGVLSTIPDLVFLAMVFIVSRYLLKALRMFFNGIANQAIRFESFDAEWAWPTYRLVRIFFIAFALVVAFPYIPGSSSDAFKGISVFLGIVFSLGSSSVIANIIAGYTMTYRRAFKLGDRIQVGEYIGDVSSVRLLVTHLKTVKNEDVVVPNSLILNTSVINYSTLARKNQLVLHTMVGIGYETPWRQVEAMLLQAADRTPDVQKEPPPYVLQKSLGDYCVNYEINVFCNNAQEMNQIYTDLHRNILDVFNENNVQIMTPSYVADTPDAKVVPKDKWFTPPARPAEE